MTGPVEVRGARPGDALLVDILDIQTISPGWCGGHAHMGPLPDGRIPRARGHVCAVGDGAVSFSSRIRLVEQPMVGCIGIGPAGQPIPCGTPGCHGGNLDHKVIGRGARAYLPVNVRAACSGLAMCTLHRVMANCPGQPWRPVPTSRSASTWRQGLSIDAPWIETSDRLMSTGTSLEFAAARREAIEQMMQALEHQLRLEPAEALALISAVADLRIGQGFGGMELTLRLEVPRALGLHPE